MGGGLADVEGETVIRFGTYNYKRPMSLTRNTHAWGTMSSRVTLQAGIGGGGVDIFFYHDDPHFQVEHY